MRKKLLYFFSLLTMWIILSQCFIMKNRWSDEKAIRIFKTKNTPILLFDTLINNRNLHYVVSGNDSLPTLVFIHGSPGSIMNYMMHMWDTALQKKYKMVSIDRPGFGYSDFGKALNLQEQCNLILPVLQGLKNKNKMYACGHSLGGPITIKLAAMDNQLFETIVIAAGSIDIEQEKKENWRKVMNVKPFYWLLPGAFGPSNTELLYLKKDLKPLQLDFEKVTCKVHFLHGSKDSWVPIENIAYGKKMLTHAESISCDTIFGAHHQIPWKNKSEFINTLLKLY